jgi:hypothetical protein
MREPWIEGKDFHNFHWTKKRSLRKGHEKLEEGEFLGGSSSCVIFLGKRRRRIMSISRWWKEGEWVGCLEYFEKIEVNRIVLGA